MLRRRQRGAAQLALIAAVVAAVLLVPSYVAHVALFAPPSAVPSVAPSQFAAPTTAPAVAPHTDNGSSDAEDDSDADWDSAAFEAEVRREAFGLGASEQPTVAAVRGRVAAIPQCAVLGATFGDYLAAYIHRHYFSAAAAAVGDGAPKSPRLVYSCESHIKGRFCGGMGDRFRGMISTFFLALLSDRRFELFHPTPVPIQRVLRPNVFNFVPRSFVVGESGGGDGESGNASAPFLAVAGGSKRRVFGDLPVAVDTRMMRLSGHTKFLKTLERAPRTNGGCLRVQSNSFGVDGFLARGAPSLAKAKTERLGLSLHGCNISCYFGCLHRVLFRPSPRMLALMRAVMAANPAAAAVTRPYVAVQVRMGGSWAAGMRIAEPFRTDPAAVPHLLAMIRASCAALSSGSGDERPDVFVSSDAEKFINLTRDAIAGSGACGRVLFVRGDEAFEHTDTLNLGQMLPHRFAAVAAARRARAYELTLLNHLLISEGRHVVMAQSGFGDTAFWRGRRSASCLFVDMTHPRFAWQHHLQYDDNGGGASSAVAVRSRVLDLRSAATEYT